MGRLREQGDDRRGCETCHCTVTSKLEKYKNAYKYTLCKKFLPRIFNIAKIGNKHKERSFEDVPMQPWVIFNKKNFITDLFLWTQALGRVEKSRNIRNLIGY